MAGGFEIFVDEDGLFRVRLKAGNGAILAQSSGFQDKSAAVRAVEAMREHAASGLISDLTGQAS